jgi:hypothetical protein
MHIHHKLQPNHVLLHLTWDPNSGDSVLSPDQKVHHLHTTHRVSADPVLLIETSQTGMYFTF